MDFKRHFFILKAYKHLYPQACTHASARMHTCRHAKAYTWLLRLPWNLTDHLDQVNPEKLRGGGGRLAERLCGSAPGARLGAHYKV